jgi:hypothetical protein
MRSKMMFDQPLPVGRIVAAIGESKHRSTIRVLQEMIC